MGCKQAKTIYPTPTDVTQPNNVQFPLHERIVTDTNLYRNKKAIDDTLEEFQCEQPNEVCAKPILLEKSISKRSDKEVQDSYPFDKHRPDRMVKINQEHRRAKRIRRRAMPPKEALNQIDLTPIDNEAFTPAICKQRQAAIDNMFYRRAILQWQPKSVEQLVRLIKELSHNKNEIDQAWIIFYWICKNIRYDTEAYFDNNRGPQTSESVFLSGTAVYSGYSTLYGDLCNRIGLQCREVSGYAKGYSFNPRQTSFEKTNHAWNILTLKNGYSYFIESTWSAAHLDRSKHSYKAKLVPFYFLCRPEHMIYNHLPKNPKWQLLTYPLTMKQYLRLPLTYNAFFELNLNILWPAYTNKVTLKGKEMYGEVLITTPTNDVQLCGSLRDESGATIEGGDFVYFDRNQNVWRCCFAPQKIGRYNILIFGRKKNNENTTSSCCVRFIFDIDYLPGLPTSYPHVWPRFFDYHLEIIKPIGSRYVGWSSEKDIPYCEIFIRSPDDIRLSATIENHSNGGSIENGSLINFDTQSMLWQCLFAPTTINVPYKITLFAKRLCETQSHSVAQFDLQEIHRKIPRFCIAFPTTYSLFYEAKCHLFGPLSGVLEHRSTLMFRCQILGAKEVKITVDGQWLQDTLPHLNEDDIFKREIQVGQREVAIWVKLDERKLTYKGLLKYSVQ